jgi:hypothetical protein
MAYSVKGQNRGDIHGEIRGKPRSGTLHRHLHCAWRWSKLVGRDDSRR